MAVLMLNQIGGRKYKGMVQSFYVESLHLTVFINLVYQTLMLFIKGETMVEETKVWSSPIFGRA